MPSPQKVRWSQLRVGIMAIAALLLLAALIVLLTGSENPFSRKSIVYTYLGDSAAMTEGSAVRLNGILVGKIKTIGLSGETTAERVIKMDLEIEDKFMDKIPVDSVIAIGAENVLGAKFLNIRRGQSAQTIRPGGELKARDDKDFLEVVQSALPLLDSMKIILGRVDNIVAAVEKGEGSIGRLLVSDEIYNRLNSTLKDVQSLTGIIVAGKGTIGKLFTEEQLYEDIRRTVGRLDFLIADLQQGNGTAGKFLKDPALYEELRKSASEIRILINELNAGKGTAGKLLKDPALHDRILFTLGNVNKTIDAVNSGQGTLGQLMVNPALYDSLNGTTAEVRALLKDFRANPKKFLTIQLKLF